MLTRPILALSILAALLSIPAFGQENAEPRVPVRRVAVLLFRGVELLDFSGPAEVFASAQGPRGRLFRVFGVAESRETLVSQGFLTIEPTRTLEEETEPDIVVIPGGSVPVANARVREWLQAVAPKAEVVMSVCNGALLLARCGLLDGLEATTHHGSIEGLTLAFPKVRVRPDLRYVDNGRIVTAGGVSAGIDGALRVVDRLCGRKAAQGTAEYMEYRWRPDDAASPVKAEARPGQALLRRVVAELETGGVPEALAAWNGMKAEVPAADVPDETRFNALAYRLLDLRTDPAPVLRLFEFNAAAFPASANVADSLSEAYERVGRFDEARRQAEKALAVLAGDAKTPDDLKERVREASSGRIERLAGLGPGDAAVYVCPPCSCDLHDRTWPAPGRCDACGMTLLPRKAGAVTPPSPEDTETARRLDDLTAALAAGTRNAATLLGDPALADLHGAPRFRALAKAHAPAAAVRMAPDGEPGTPFAVVGRVLDPDGRPIARALVYAFHTDATGRYTAGEGMDESHSRLFAYVRTGDDGRFALETIRPGGYPEPVGRTGGTRAGIPEHVHFQIGADGFADRFVTIHFEDDPRLDAHARSEIGAHGDLVVPVAKDAAGRPACAFEVRIPRR